MSRKHFTAVAVAIAMLTTGVVMVAPTVFAEEGDDGPSADSHCRWRHNHRTYIRGVSPDPVEIGDDLDVRVYMDSEDYTTNHFTGYLKSPSGEWTQFYHHHDYCSSHTHTFGTEAPLEPGTYEVWAFGAQYYDPGPDRYQSADRVTIEVLPPDIQVDRDAPSDVKLGDTFRTELTATYEGDGLVEDFTLTEDLAENVDLARGGDTWTDSTVSWNVGDLGPGDSVTVAYEAEATAPRAGSFVASGSMQGFDLGTLGDRDTVTVIGPEIDATRELVDTVNSGEVTTVEVTFTNTGTAAAQDVTLADTFESAYTPVPTAAQADADAGGVQDGAVSPQVPGADAGFAYGTPAADQTADPVTVKGDEDTTLTWSLDSLGVGESLTVRYDVQAPAHVPLLAVDEPDAPEQPDPEDPQPPVLPTPGEPNPEDNVDDNEGTYAFTASATFATSTGIDLGFDGDGAQQTVSALHQTQVDEPEPPAEPPEELPDEPPEQP